MGHSLERKITVGHFTALLLLCLTGALSLWQLHQYRISAQWSDHTRQVLAAITQLSQDIRNAESNERGFLITEDQAYLELMNRSIDQTAQTRRLIGQLSSDNPRQQARLARLSPMLDARLDNFRRSVALFKSDGWAASRNQVISGNGKVLMAQIHGILEEMTQEEEGLLRTRLESQTSSAHATMIAIIAGLVLALGLALLARYLIRQETLRRNRAEAELKQQSEAIRDLYENAPCGYHSLDENGTLIQINACERSWLGYEAEEVVGRLKFADLLTPASIEHFREVFPRFKQEGVIRDTEFDMIRKDGSILPVIMNATAILDAGGKYVSSRCSLNDITERRRADSEMRQARLAADAANRSKSEFLANMSHEIRTPLTAIVGYADLLLDPERTESDRLNNINVIRRNAQHLLALISGILDLSKIEAGEMRVECIPCSACQIVADVASSMRVPASEKGLELAVKIHGPIPQMIRTDPTRLRQVLINLVNNAIKFTVRGKVLLAVEMLAGNETLEPQLKFCVTDTGIGMTPEQIGRLFQPFMQADTSTTRRFGGSGLGLSISERLVRMLGGEISVTSVPDEGSQFGFSIRTGSLEGVEMLADCTEAMKSVQPRARDSQIRLAGRILLAEDGSDNRQLLARYLQRAGAEVYTAENGQVAAEMTIAALDKGEPFNLIFMDMQMPVMDGYAAASKLRRKGVTIPIVALTAHAMAEDRNKCLRSGCTDYLTKPVSRLGLLEMASKHLQGCCGAAAEHNGGQEVIAPQAIDNEDLLEFLPRFIAGLPGEVARIQGLLDQRELDALREAFHQLKGSGGLYGFPQITGSASAAEKAVLGGDLESVQKATRELIELIRRVQGYPKETRSVKTVAD